jgi:hypothetical protein
MRERRSTAMPAPLPDDLRETVLVAARQPGATRNGVARQTGVSPASVTRICSAAGVSFDRAATASAVQARVIDLRAARVTLAGDLLGDIGEARARMYAAVLPRDFFDLARSVAALTNSHVRIVAVDGTEHGVEEARGMLGNLMEWMKVYHQEQDGDDAP